MQFLKLTPEQRHIKRWRTRRNHLVCKLLDQNALWSRSRALRVANQIMGAEYKESPNSPVKPANQKKRPKYDTSEKDILRWNITRASASANSAERSEDRSAT